MTDKPNLIIQATYDEKLFNEIIKETTAATSKIDPSSKILFLDIDGVLNSDRFIDAHPKLPYTELIDKEAVSRVLSIIEKTGAKIVISSSWREQFINEPNGFNKMVEFFKKFGIEPIVGMTPKLRGKARHYEIEEWLNNHKVANFAIIDDDAYANVPNKLVKTLFVTGLLDCHVEEAVKILMEKSGEINNER